MTGADLLPLLQEIEKRGGPIDVEEPYVAWTVRVHHRFGKDVSCSRPIRSVPGHVQWAIIGALLEALKAKGTAPRPLHDRYGTRVEHTTTRRAGDAIQERVFAVCDAWRRRTRIPRP